MLAIWRQIWLLILCTIQGKLAKESGEMEELMKTLEE